jgi:hypothetical protein
MSVFRTAKARHAAAAMEEMFYGMAAQELASNRPSTGLFAKANVEALGDAAKTNAIYIRLRVRALQLEKSVLREEVSGQARATQEAVQALIKHGAAIKWKQGESARFAIIAWMLILVVGAPCFCLLLGIYFHFL